MSENNSSRIVEKGKDNLKQIVGTARTVSRVAKSGVLSGLKSVIGAIGWKVFVPVLIVMVIMCLLAVLVASASPFGDAGLTLDQLGNMKSKVQVAVEDAFKNAKKKSRKKIIEYVNENYECNAIAAHVNEWEDGSYDVIVPASFNSNGCDIHVEFTPGIETMLDNITAYYNAVNSTIHLYMGDQEEEIVTEPEGPFCVYIDENAFTFNEEGGLEYSEYGQNWYNEMQVGEENVKSDDDDFYEEIKKYKNEYFMPDPASKRWDIEVEIVDREITTKRKVLIENGHIKPLECEPDEDGCTVVSTTVKVAEGTITIPMYYDLSGYKAQELAELKMSLVGEQACPINWEDEQEGYKECTDAEVDRLVYETIEHYYGTHGASYGDMIIDEESKTVTDNRYEIFHKLIEDGIVSFIPVSGVPFSLLERIIEIDGVEQYLEALGFDSGLIGELLPTIAGNIDWSNPNAYISEINAIARQFGFTMNSLQCTSAALARFYSVNGYGFTIANGNGMASSLYSGNNGYVPSGSPAANSIVSFDHHLHNYGHVLYVEAVNGDQVTVTGTSMYWTGVQTRTMSRTEMEQQGCRYQAGCEVTYAVPGG